MLRHHWLDIRKVSGKLTREKIMP